MNNEIPSRFEMVETIFDLIGHIGGTAQGDHINTAALEDAMYLFEIPEGCTRKELYEIEGKWKQRIRRKSDME